MMQTNRNTLILDDEVQLYSKAWDLLLARNVDLLSNILETQVRELHPNRAFDTEKAKEFLSQFAPKPPLVQIAVQTTTKPVNFCFNECLYDKGIDEKPIKNWTSCWLKFCYVLKETLSDYDQFGKVVSYRLPNRSPFWETDERWQVSHQIQGTNIYVHPHMSSKQIKEEMIVLAKWFGYDPPIIKEVDKQSTRNLKPKRPE